VTPADLPKGSDVKLVKLSPHDAGTAYVVGQCVATIILICFGRT